MENVMSYLFITCFTLTFSKNLFYIANKIFELTNCKNKSLRGLPLFESGFKKKDIKQCRSVQ